MHISSSQYNSAQMGLASLKRAIVGLLSEYPEGLRNVEIASALGIRSDHDGKQEDCLSSSVLGLLMRSGVVQLTNDSRYRLFRLESE